MKTENEQVPLDVLTESAEPYRQVAVNFRTSELSIIFGTHRSGKTTLLQRLALLVASRSESPILYYRHQNAKGSANGLASSVLVENRLHLDWTELFRRAGELKLHVGLGGVFIDDFKSLVAEGGMTKAVTDLRYESVLRDLTALARALECPIVCTYHLTGAIHWADAAPCLHHLNLPHFEQLGDQVIGMYSNENQRCSLPHDCLPALKILKGHGVGSSHVLRAKDMG